MEHSLVAWPAVHVIRERLAALSRAGLMVTRVMRARLGLQQFRVRSGRTRSQFDPLTRGVDAQTPQPLAAFPVVRSLVAGDPWFADGRVRVQRVWEREAWDGQPAAFFIARKGHPPAAGLLIHGLELEYCRLYPSYALAAVDGLFWFREIGLRPEALARGWQGADPRGRPWMVRVVARPRRWELHLSHGGVHGSILPSVYQFRSQEDAFRYAEIFMRSPLTTRQ